MVDLLIRKSFRDNIKEVSPAVAILLATLFISTFVTEFTFTFGITAIWKTIFRFLRLSFVLTIPLIFLPHLCSFAQRIFNRKNTKLLLVQEERDLIIHPLKNWLIRPFQGIGLSMLLASKLLTFLQIYGRTTVTVETILPPGQFSIGRFLMASAIAVIVSILLSFLWTLDDLGVRYYNNKSQEIKMIGKYVGIILPIFFGFYGILSIFDEYERFLASIYIMQMIIVLYPPLVVFSVMHNRYLQKKEEALLIKLKAYKGVIVTDQNMPAASA